MSSFRVISGLSILAAAILPLNGALADTSPSTAVNPQSAAAPGPPTTGNDRVAMASAGSMDANAPAGPADDAAYRLKAGDPNVVSNAPIPDTAKIAPSTASPIA